jgi:hypothetical protein
MTIKGQQQLTSSEAPNNANCYSAATSGTVTTSSQLSHDASPFWLAVTTGVAASVSGLVFTYNLFALLTGEPVAEHFGAAALSAGAFVVFAGWLVVLALCNAAAPKSARERAADDEAQMQALKAARK